MHGTVNEVLSKGIKELKKGSNEEYAECPKGEAAICMLVCRIFTTRNLLHFAHWNTDSFAAHMATGELYDAVIEDVDEIIEVFQGKNGLISDFHTGEACLDKDILNRVREDAIWVEKNRDAIAGGDTAIGNLVDTLLGHLHKTTYKLANLK